MKKNRLPPLKPKKERELLKAAKPVVTIFSAISKLKKTIAEKEKKINSKDKSSTEIEKLKSELKKKEKELQKLGEKKIKKGEEATRLLLYRNQHLVDYLAAGYYSKGRKIDNEELKSEGIASLPKAIEKFDLNSKNKFSTYAGF
jgi:DNA-directed RNA polymerase sigma subunit (sigma70/sigma32)